MSSKMDDLSSLHERVSGTVTTPRDSGYDSERKVFYGGIDAHPGALVRVTGPEDIVIALSFARESGMDIAVRSGGHSIAGHSTTEGGLVIDVRGLDRIDIDPELRTAWAGSGVTAGQFTNAAGEHGLGVGFGDTGSVGLGGITLGGGVGFLVRKYGLTIDSVLRAELVTADGEVLLVDAENHPDLFWAIRGGGGNFGVATRFEYVLNPVDPFVGGLLILPATAEVVQGWIDISAGAPDELSTMANVMSAPPMPFIPDELVGTSVVIGMVAWCGDVEPGLEMMDRYRDLGEPLMDMLGEMPYPAIYQEEEEEYAPTAAARTGFTDQITDEKVATILEAIESSDAPMRVVQLRQLGGAMARIPADATAFAHRDREIMVNVAAFYEDEEDRVRRETWVDDLHKVLTDGDDRGYAGFLGDEGEHRIRAAYPGRTWDRLREVKRRYDPDNVFSANQNIPPAS